MIQDVAALVVVAAALAYLWWKMRHPGHARPRRRPDVPLARLRRGK
jgi:hypothetical protein